MSLTTLRDPDELKNIDSMLEYYERINKKIINSIKKDRDFIRNIKELVPKNNKCFTCMGHQDIRPIGACLECSNIYNIANFKEKCDNYVFEVEYGNLLGKELIIKYFPNSLMILKAKEDLPMNPLTKSKKIEESIYISNSDYFSNSFICSLIVDKVLTNSVNKIYVGFICKNKGFQLLENPSIDGLQNTPKDERYLLTNFVYQVASILDKLRDINFMHGNLTIENVSVFMNDNSYVVKLNNLEYSSLTYKGKRFFKSGPNIDQYIQLDIQKKYFILGNDSNNLMNNIRFSGRPIYPCIIDFYCFIISLLCKKELYDILMEDNTFTEEIYKKIFYTSDQTKLQINLLHDEDKVTYLDCLNILRDVRLKYNVFELIL